MTDEELIEQVARAIYNDGRGPRVTPFDQSPKDAKLYWYDRARAAIAAMQPRFKAEVDKWRNAVIDELMSCHIYRREHEADPRKALHEVITWNCRVALDPAVSAEARALMVRGGEMVKEAAARVAATYDDNSPYRSRAEAIRALSVPAIVEAGDGKK